MNETPKVLQIVQRCEALFEDLNFNAVKQWKAAAPGRRVRFCYIAGNCALALSSQWRDACSSKANTASKPASPP